MDKVVIASGGTMKREGNRPPALYRNEMRAWFAFRRSKSKVTKGRTFTYATRPELTTFKLSDANGKTRDWYSVIAVLNVA